MISHIRTRWFWATGLALLASATHAQEPSDLKAAAKSADKELRSIAEDAYIYGYPLVLMDLTARMSINVPTPEKHRAPINQFARLDVLPDASFSAIVAPNVDTLYTSAFIDLIKEPVVLHVPDTEGRYYLMPMLDAYTNVFASPGKRTTGTKELNVALVGPGWEGELPPGLTKIEAPTNLVWLLGRTQINGKQDMPAVIALTNQYTLTPLSAYGTKFTPPKNDRVLGTLDMETPPPKQVAKLGDRAYFERLATLLKKYPPPPADTDALARFAKIGLEPGKFEPSPAAAKATQGVSERAEKRMHDHMAQLGRVTNGWMIETDLGRWGHRYLDRGTVARWGLGANLPEDAIYPVALKDAKGAPLTGEHSYVLHFAKGQEPPANAFWSITMYNAENYLVANPIDRYAIGSRDTLKRNPDGSVDILVQHDAPEGELAANWLPAPAEPFSMVLRIYWPKSSVIDGSWNPPAVRRVEAP